MSASATSAQISRIAQGASEIQSVQRLLYQTFVEEIPHHPANLEQLYVDRFHEENTYFVCLRKGQLLGTIAYRAQRPFSLDQKLGNLDDYLPPGRRLCEIRLLAVVRKERYSKVAFDLMRAVAEYATGQGCNSTVISGTIRQLKLYRHLGFQPFGPLVGKPGAEFQPMHLSLEAFLRQTAAWRPTSVSSIWNRSGTSHTPGTPP